MITLTHVPSADWLPPGGVAEVVLAEPGDAVPSPVSLVRLLVTDAAGRIFCVARTGGREGWDLPTAAAGSDAPSDAVIRLTTEVLGHAVDTDVVGWVRNIVADSTAYEWPSPRAHFVVLRPSASSVRPVVDGVWLDRPQADAELSERHWWPLLSVGHAARPEID